MLSFQKIKTTGNCVFLKPFMIIFRMQTTLFSCVDSVTADIFLDPPVVWKCQGNDAPAYSD